MTLLIDLGNSRLKWSRLDPSTDCASHAFVHAGRLTSNDLGQLVSSGPQPQLVVCAAVADQNLVDTLTDFCMATWDLKVEYVQSAERTCGLVNSYKEPQLLGVDRWLAMLAARSRVEGWFCLIDAGTAITVDLVDDKGRHRGGWIVPSERLMQRLLTENTARVSGQDGTLDTTWGTTTADAVALGARAAVSGMIAMAEHSASKFATKAPQYVVTGGDGSRIIEFLEGPAMLVPDLVLDGLALWVREMHNL